MSHSQPSSNIPSLPNSRSFVEDGLHRKPGVVASGHDRVVREPLHIMVQSKSGSPRWAMRHRHSRLRSTSANLCQAKAASLKDVDEFEAALPLSGASRVSRMALPGLAAFGKKHDA